MTLDAPINKVTLGLSCRDYYDKRPVPNLTCLAVFSFYFAVVVVQRPMPEHNLLWMHDNPLSKKCKTEGSIYVMESEI